MGLATALNSASPGAAAVVAVACSGGRDSLALLHCTVKQALPSGIQVLALHVNHGLQAQAAQWQAHVQAIAQRWGASFASEGLQGKPKRGQSVEAWARQGRYEALAKMAKAHGCGLVLLAHHRQDQAETFLLQALRGAGLAGLASMPRLVQREGVSWLRPWLEHSGAAIDAYAKRHRLKWVQDPSNLQTQFSRNRLRLQVWPSLLANFPDAGSALAQAARRSAQQALALSQALQPVLAGLCSAEGQLQLDAWRQQPPALRQELLALWLAEQIKAKAPPMWLQAHAAPSVRQMAQVCARLENSTAPMRLALADGELLSYRGQLAWQMVVAAPAQGPQTLRPKSPAKTHVISPAKQLVKGLEPANGSAASLRALFDVSAPGFHTFPGWPGRLEVLSASATGQPGVPASSLKSVCALPRQGSEQISLAPAASARSLKKQFQALGVPQWQRTGPLIYSGKGHLLFVPSLGVNGQQMATSRQAQRWLVWHPV